MLRRTDEFLFFLDAPATVLAWMDMLAAGGDGWLNLSPQIPGEEKDGGSAPRGSPSRPGFFTVLSGPTPPSTPVCTWVPTGRGKTGVGSTVGIMHARGRKAIDQLGALGVALPRGWRVQQDHARRGLVVGTPPDAEHADVLDWLCRAGAALSFDRADGPWKAVVHLPRDERVRDDRGDGSK